MTMDTIYRLRNPVRTYPWGSRSFIQKLLRDPIYEGVDVAELWMGANTVAPSEVLMGSEWIPLDRAIARGPEKALGHHDASRFSGTLPFLFKVLAVDRPLSLQVHPDRQKAMEGFERENRRRVPLNDPARNYRDSSPKPEMVCALTSFDVLKGFRRPEEILFLFRSVAPPELESVLDPLGKEPGSGGLETFFKDLVHMKKDRLAGSLSHVAHMAHTLRAEDPAYAWVSRLSRSYPGDVGVLAPLMLNPVRLDPGEALYVGPGELHTYLGGAAMEIMASSDNVVRVGLTGKHVDAREVVNLTRFESDTPIKLGPAGKECGEAAYPRVSEEFGLSVISVGGNCPHENSAERGAEIMICMEGEVRVSGENDHGAWVMNRGDSVFIPVSVPGYTLEGEGRVYKALVPR